MKVQPRLRSAFSSVVGVLPMTAVVLGLAAAVPAQSPPAPYRTIAPAMDPAARPFTALDADGDGDQDLLTSRGVELNDGGGRFTHSAGALPSTINPSQIILARAADMDGDGDEDLVVVWAPGGAVLGEIYWNTGGVFATSVWLAFGPFYYGGVTAPAGLVLADFDGNGLLDVAGPSFGLTIHLQTSPGVFLNSTAAVLAAAGNPGPGLRLLGGADLNADGFVDLLCDAAGVSILFTGSSTGFTAAAVPAGFLGNPTSAAVGDFNGDGRDDFVVSRSSLVFGALDEFVFAPVGGGTFAIGILRPAVARLGALDVDGDGRDDVLRITATTSDAVDYLTGASRASPPMFDASATVPAGLSTIAPRFLVFDADQDGDADLVGMRAANVYAIAFRTSAGAFRLEESDLTMAAGGGTPVVADFDQDGDLDLARAASPGGASSLVLRRNDGKGRFGAPVVSGTIERPTMGLSVTGDFDGDADLDVFEFNGVASPILHLQGPPGRFTATTLASATGGTAIVASVVDVDADGDLDVQVVGTFGSLPVSGLHRYLNAAAAFTGPFLVAPFGVSRAVSLIADADAIPDFAVTASNGTLNAYLISVVSGATGAALAALTSVSYSTGYTGAIAAGDLDNDGDADVVLETTAFLANGLTYSAIPAPGPAPLAISDRVRFIRDVDGDGVRDILEISSDSGVVYYGAPGPAYGPGTPFAANYGSASVVVADFDRDGDPDLIDRAGRLLTNVTAHAASGRTAAIGRTSSIELYGAGTAPFALYAAPTAFTQNPVAIPGWGGLWLDPNTIVAVGPGALDANGRTELSFVVPNLPTLAGVTLWWQAVLPGSSRLTGVARSDFYLP